MNYKSYAYRNESDYQRIRELLAQNCKVISHPIYLTVGDLDYNRFIYEDEPEAIETARIWEDEAGIVIGFAWPYFGGVDMVSLFSKPNIENEMLRWSEDYLRSIHSEEVATWSSEDDSVRNELLKKYGYTKTEEARFSSRLSLDALEIPIDTTTSEFKIRAIDLSTDLDQRLKLHPEATGDKPATAEQYLRMTQSPTYNKELDLVIEGPNASIVGFCTTWFDKLSNTGLLEPLACSPDYRKRGLMGNLLNESLRRLKALGATHVYVGTSLDNLPAIALYKSVGFKQVGSLYQWVKKL